MKKIRISAYWIAGVIVYALILSCSSGGNSASQNGEIAPPPPPPPSFFTVTVTFSGLGAGQVTSPDGLNCQSGTFCSQTYSSGTLLTLTPATSGNSGFAGWGGACATSGTSDCNLPVSTNETVNAIFSPGAAINITAVSAGAAHTCILVTQSGPACFGDDTYGQLGDGTNNTSFAPVQTQVANGVSIQSLSAGGNHSCGVLSSGAVNCWGDNSYGQLGNGTVISSNVPVSVTGINSASRISAGGYHTCSLMSDGSVQCFGFNANGQLGNNSTTDSSTPVAVNGIPPGITKATAISSGSQHTCALISDGTVYCWGLNSSGQFGNSSTANSNV
ncbi:MAG: RCC1 domain-containing protein, partial [Nitrospiria bacterium]